MITYLSGDATQPTKTPAAIVHVCNDLGGWGRGFVLALSSRWSEPETAYRRLATYSLGDVQAVRVTEDVTVMNCIAQHGYASKSRPQALDLSALHACLGYVNDYCRDHTLTVHMPRIGCGLGGALWEDIEVVILKTLTVPVYVYDWELS